MAALGGRFESARSIEERKEQTRIARAEVLRQAKSNFEKEQRRKELRQLRGEDTWMLPDVNERIEQFSQEHSVKKKKKKDKHSKKVKKEKKKKSKKQKCENRSESTDSSSSSEEWVEAVPSQTLGKEKTWKVKDEKPEEACGSHVMQRDEWMTVDFMSVKTVSSSSLKAEKETLRKTEQEKAQALEQSKLLERELNPYWKDGGSGLPSENCIPVVTKASRVEDGGLSWLRKSYRRMKEQAQKENRNFEDIVAEKYGSMEIFQSKLKEAENIAHKREDCGREQWRKPAYADRTQCSHAGGTSDLVRCKKGSEDKHFATETANSSSRSGGCKVSCPETGKRSGSLETCERESALRQRQESSGNLRPKFLRPSDEDELSFHSKRRNFESSTLSSTLVDQTPLHFDFRKSTENSEENLTSWSLSGRRKDDQKHSDQRPSETWSCSADQHSPGVSREHLQAESFKTDPPRTGHLQDAKSTFAGPEAESTNILSVDEKNKLGARIIKAEMMGNMELAEQLKAQLKEANKFKETTTQISAKRSGVEHEAEEVILVRTDDSGRAWPVNSTRESLSVKAERRKRQRVSTHEDKERIRYFPDDDHLSLNDLIKNEKMGTDVDQNRLFMRMATKFMGKPDDDHYTLDDMFVSKAAEKEHLGEKEESQRRKAIAEHQSLATQMANCLYCFDSSQFPKHLIVAIGVKVYLCLPNFRSLTEGHCLIVPLQHLQAATMLDEDIWEEIQKAIMESDEEWSMNKKLIDLSSKDIRKSVPRGLPYFAVDFGLQGGFAHVIEDQHKFPHYFGKEIIGGMLDLEPRLWRKGIRESFEDQRKKALQFAQWWKPFDVTKSKSC
ncbi:CWF19-like protein 2 isoform X2 [Mesocricetus auratus]|uniref:CWF19-like protein 2 isoform X2 n=1 Tax=Mesocricetus auratus TaxID=10036 RepID=A0ABM2WLC0_MESAU|nr:CWF19-like protein 2 isoform X2 [Mesocricetus auratus]